ncbi:MAG: ABC transporter ATP-binding protein/permease [Eubacteriales bacterium]|nr:ABC transporter ATP-binding protein/permease [Eubacteriales bacterium]
MKKIRLILSHVKQYTKYLLLTPVFSIIESAMGTVTPIITAKLVDEGIQGGNLDVVKKMALFYVLTTLFNAAIGMLGGICSARAGVGFSTNLRQALYYKVQEFSFANIDKFSTASIVTRCTSDVNNIQMALMQVVRMLVRVPASIIFAMIMAFRTGGKMAFIFLLVMPVLGISLGFISAKVHPVFQAMFKKTDNLNNIVRENVRSIRVVKGFIREEYEIQKLKAATKAIYDNNWEAQKIMSLNMPIMSLCMNTCTLLISWLGAKMIIQGVGNFTVGNLQMLLSYTMQILSSLMSVSMVYVMLTQAAAAINRVYDILVEKSTITDPEDPIFEVPDGSVQFENVDFSYSGDEERLSLKDVSLKINSGETIGILGGTGSGKSSLVSLIPRLYDVTEGDLKVGGIDVRQYDLTALRDSVAVVLQNNVLFSGTIKENLRWGKEDATDEELVEVCKMACADEFIRQFPDGYDTVLDQGGTNVSGGQKQRLCIARALLKRPKIIIFDDSTSAVDTKTDARIRQALKDYIPETTKIIIAQRVASVHDADKILILDNGEVNGFDTPENLLKTNKIYQEVYNSQTQGGLE